MEGAGFGTAANTRLLFDQMPATVLSVTATRLTAIVPYALDGKTFTQAQVQSAGVLSNPVWFVVAPTSPGIYTVDGSGTGQALALNQDGTPNSPSNPAAVGSTITFYATGAGQTIPPGADGVLHRSGPAAPYNNVAIFIAESYISGPQFNVGPAPGFPADVFTVKAVVPNPTGLNLPNLVQVQIEIGSVVSQAQPLIFGSSTVEIGIKPKADDLVQYRTDGRNAPLGSLYSPTFDISVMGCTTRLRPLARHQRNSSELRDGTRIPAPANSSAAAIIAWRSVFVSATVCPKNASELA